MYACIWERGTRRVRTTWLVMTWCVLCLVDHQSRLKPLTHPLIRMDLAIKNDYNKDAYPHLILHPLMAERKLKRRLNLVITSYYSDTHFLQNH